MSRDPRHRLGRLGEQAAADHLERLGFAIIARNHRTRFGELDVIACNGATLVFAEVKTRRAGGAPFEAMTALKRRRVRQIAAAWLVETPGRPRAETVRFDAIGVTVDAAGRLAGLEHLEGAF